MWRDYFGSGLQLVGVDVSNHIHKFENQFSWFTAFVGDQSNRTFMSMVANAVGTGIDIVIDDGGHHMHQQINSFEVLYPYLQPNGVYIVEDCLTSYYESYGAGLLKAGTFIEYSKQLIDTLHAWHYSSSDAEVEANSITRSLGAVTFYDSMVVVQKQLRAMPYYTTSGLPDSDPLLTVVTTDEIPSDWKLATDRQFPLLNCSIALRAPMTGQIYHTTGAGISTGVENRAAASVVIEAGFSAMDQEVVTLALKKAVFVITSDHSSRFVPFKQMIEDEIVVRFLPGTHSVQIRLVHANSTHPFCAAHSTLEAGFVVERRQV